MGYIKDLLKFLGQEQKLNDFQKSSLKARLLNMEKKLFGLSFKSIALILLTSNAAWFLYAQQTSPDKAQQLYWSTTRFLSRQAGNMAQWHLPLWLRKPLFETYCRIYNVVLDDMIEPDLGKYETVMQFFTREVKPREYSHDRHDLIAPADSIVLSYSEITKDSTLLVKNVNYSVGELLTGDPRYKVEDELMNDVKKSENPEKSNLYSVIFYLAPGDYHRYHCPADCSFKARHHMLGHLVPVKISHISKTPGVYESNERVALAGEYAFGFMALVFVGAFNVGSIVLHFDDLLKTNLKLTERPKYLGSTRMYTVENKTSEVWAERGLNMPKGSELGMFKLGSTIVMIFEAENVDWQVKFGDKVRWGQTFAVVNKVEQAVQSS